MELKLERARVGLKLAVQQINSSTIISQDDDDVVSSNISVGGGSEETYYNSLKNDGKHVNNCLPEKKTEIKETMIKKPKLDNSKHSQNFKSNKHKHSSIMISQNDDDVVSSNISVGGGSEETYYNSPKNDGKHVNNCLPEKKTEIKETMIKKPKLDNSKHSQNFKSNKHKHSSIMISQNDEDVVSSNISLGRGSEDRYYNSPKNYGKHVKNCLPEKKTEIKETMIKKPKLDNSKHSQNFKSNKHKQPDIVTCSKKKSELIKIGNKSSELLSPPTDNIQLESCVNTSSSLFGTVVDSGFAESCTNQKSFEVTTKNTKLDSLKNPKTNINDQQKNSELCDGEIESLESNCSTYCSAFEDECCDNSFKLQGKNVQIQENSCGQSLTESTLINSSTHQSSTYYFIRTFLDVLEDETQTFDPNNSLFMTEVINDFVQLAESNSVKAVQQCKTEAVKCLQKLYERFLKCSKTGAPFEGTQWRAYSILQMLCDSKNICEEFIKFFASRMMTPKIITNLEDPKQSIESSAEYDTARFNLIQLHNALRKYSKLVEKNDCQSNNTQSYNNEFYIELLKKLNEYRTTLSDNFLDLKYIAVKNVMLLNSRK